MFANYSCFAASPRRLFVAAAGLSLMLAGCGPSVGTVTGTVNYQGKPLPQGSITIQSDTTEEGVNNTARGTISNGTYKVEEVPTGPAKISIQTPRAAAASKTPPPTAPGIQMPQGEAQVPTGPVVEVPAKYQTVDSSGLTIDVQSGTQTHNIDLE